MVPDPSITPSGSGAGQARSSNLDASESSREEQSQSSQLSQNSDDTTSRQEGNREQESSTMGTEDMQETADLLDKTASVLNRNLQFDVLPEENVVQAKIINQENEEVIQKIPPDELVELRKTIDTFIGMFVDELR